MLKTNEPQLNLADGHNERKTWWSFQMKWIPKLLSCNLLSAALVSISFSRCDTSWISTVRYHAAVVWLCQRNWCWFFVQWLRNLSLSSCHEQWAENCALLSCCHAMMLFARSTICLSMSSHLIYLPRSLFLFLSPPFVVVFYVASFSLSMFMFDWCFFFACLLA